MIKPLLALAAAVAALLAILRRRKAHADAEQLWREATSDASR